MIDLGCKFVMDNVSIQICQTRVQDYQIYAKCTSSGPVPSVPNQRFRTRGSVSSDNLLRITAAIEDVSATMFGLKYNCFS